MQISLVTALDDTYGKDVSGNVVEMLNGTSHLVSNTDIEFYIARTALFVITISDVNIASYALDSNGIPIGFVLPSGSIQLFSTGSGSGNGFSGTPTSILEDETYNIPPNTQAFFKRSIRIGAGASIRIGANSSLNQIR